MKSLNNKMKDLEKRFEYPVREKKNNDWLIAIFLFLLFYFFAIASMIAVHYDTKYIEDGYLSPYYEKVEDDNVRDY